MAWEHSTDPKNSGVHMKDVTAKSARFSATSDLFIVAKLSPTSTPTPVEAEVSFKINSYTGNGIIQTGNGIISPIS